MGEGQVITAQAVAFKLLYLSLTVCKFGTIGHLESKSVVEGLRLRDGHFVRTNQHLLHRHHRLYAVLFVCVDASKFWRK